MGRVRVKPSANRDRHLDVGSGPDGKGQAERLGPFVLSLKCALAHLAASFLMCLVVPLR